MKPATLTEQETAALRADLSIQRQWSPPRGTPGGMPALAKVVDGFVYFIEIGGRGGPIKIGWALDPKARMATLQTGAAARMRLVRKRPGTRADEAELHRRFAAVRIRARGEWFWPSAELRVEIYHPAARR